MQIILSTKHKLHATLEAAEIHIANVSTILTLSHSGNFTSLSSPICPHTLHHPQFPFTVDHTYLSHLFHMSGDKM